MSDNERLQEILNQRKAELVKKEAWLEEVGMDKVSDEKLANKRIKIRREISDLKTWIIPDLEEMII